MRTRCFVFKGSFSLVCDLAQSHEAELQRAVDEAEELRAAVDEARAAHNALAQEHTQILHLYEHVRARADEERELYANLLDREAAAAAAEAMRSRESVFITEADGLNSAL